MSDWSGTMLTSAQLNQLNRSEPVPRWQLTEPGRDFNAVSECRCRKVTCSWKVLALVLLLTCAFLAAFLTYFAVATNTCQPLPPEDVSCVMVDHGRPEEKRQFDNTAITTTHHPNPPFAQTESQQIANRVAPTLAVHPPIHSTLREDPPNKLYENSYLEEIYPNQDPINIQVRPFSFWIGSVYIPSYSVLKLNLLVPRASPLALYGRRNVPPTVTQFDFSEFLRFMNSASIPDDERRHGKAQRFAKRYKRSNDERSTFVSFLNVTSSPVTLARVNRAANYKATRDARKYSAGPQSEPEIPDTPKFTKRLQTQLNLTVTQLVEGGKWYIGVYNDDVIVHDITLHAQTMEDEQTTCINACSGHGTCSAGKCFCEDGYTGKDCSVNICPVLCSGRGYFLRGKCKCDEGWSGAECEISAAECPVEGCGEHGICSQGHCLCESGYSGTNCQERDCELLGCPAKSCAVDCGARGAWNETTNSCTCQPGWDGEFCTKQICNLNCGLKGVCEDGKCVCQSGWEGPYCDVRTCDHRCFMHGQCKNGTCVCARGWNGKHCTLEGCPMECGGHGECTSRSGPGNEYYCHCREGWSGNDCSIPLEMNCDDDIDNDGDGLVDCADTECCSRPECTGNLMCLSSPEPIDILLRKQPPPVSASFYQRAKFLIEENAVQSYAHRDEYSESEFWTAFNVRRATIVRGRVVNGQGTGITGVRVSIENQPRLGFTLSRNGGWYDLLINGGGAVNIQFQRSPFHTETRTVMTPWNKIVVIDDVTMRVYDERKSDEPMRDKLVQECSPQLYGNFTLEPTIITTWNPNLDIDNPVDSDIFFDGQVVRNSVNISDTNLKLIHRSTSTPGYRSILLMTLTPDAIPDSLKYIHIQVTVEGSVFKKTFEADSNILHVFSWDRKNVYKQKVYGLTEAVVAVGYEYHDCDSVIWHHSTVTLKGYDVDISNIGGWNLNVHHHYNHNEGILQKGDGSSVYFSDYPRLLKNVAGVGLQRTVECTECSRPTEPQKAQFQALSTLATGPDGSIYIADFNYIRKLTSDGKLITVVKLGTSLISYQYHLAVSPFDNSIFISDPEKRQVLQVVFPPIDGHPSMVDLTQPAMSSQRSDRGFWLVYAGNGQICTIDDEKQCGDGGLAKEAQLSYPKGIVMDGERSLYIADGRTIRKVDSRGVIQTVVGVGDFPDLSAFGSSCADPTNLVHWPTKLAVNPLDNLLYWSERSSIYKLAKEKIHLVAGLPDFCTAPATRKAPIRIGNVIDFTITPSGRIVIAAQKGDKTLFEVSTRGEITSIKCASDTYQYIYESNITTIQPTLALTDSADCNQPITSIAVTPDNSLYIGDSKRLKLYQLISPIPNPDSNGEYTIQWPKTGEVFVFNRYGHHIGTKCLLTDRVRYVFVYNKNTSLGKLTMVTDATGGRVTVVRDYTDAATGIETHGGTKMHVTVARHGLLSTINETRYGSHYAFDYDGVTGFITGREEPTGDTFFFAYDDLGRLSKFVSPTGETHNLNYKLNGINHEVSLAHGAEVISSIEISGNSWKNRRQNLASWTYADGSQYLTMSGTKEFFEGELQAVLTNPLRFKGNFSEWRKVSTYKVRLADDFIQQSRSWKMKRAIDWKGKAILEASYLKNNVTFMTMEAELPSGRITILDRDRIPLLVSEPQDGGIRYWNLPWNPSQRKATEFSSVDTGQEVSLQKNVNGISYSVVVNRHGKISMMTLPSGRNFRYIYQENSGLRGITFPSGTTHDFGIEASFDYYKFIHHHSGTSKQLVHHFSLEGNLLLTLLPGDLGRTVYRYNNQEHLREIVSGYDRYVITHGPVTTVRYLGRDIEYKCDFVCVTEGVCTEIKFDFGGKSGLANARFLFKYDQNLRVVGIKGRIGGQALPEQNSKFSDKTDSLSQINDFKFSKLSLNETSIYDGTAAFQKHIDSNLRIWKTTLTINDAELFRAEYIYDRSGRINQTRTFIRYVGLKSFINVKNFTYDPDGQLIAVDSPESWNFQYDTRGNLALLNYRGNAIPVQHDQQDRMTRLGEGFYAYDEGGRVLQNAREEKYQWSSSGLLIKAAKKGLLEVKYTYDHYKRLIARRDHHGNLTQFFYTDLERPHLVTHMYSSRDARLVSYTYDDRGHLIFIQYQRYKFYVATDLCGTPLVLFNQYGEIVREMVRSPYGHVVYDSNPYIYIGIDWCGSLIDPATGLVHSPEGQVYDPLLGQYLAPNYDVFLKHVYDPIRLHFYRINGNDPINFRKEVKLPAKTEDIPEVLSLLGYNVGTAQSRRSIFDMTYNGLNIFARFVPSIHSGINSVLTPKHKEEFLNFMEPSQILKPHDIFEFKFARQSSSLGKGLVATSETKNMRLYSAANSDTINRDVYTSILSQSAKLPVNSYHGHQDIFYFFKEGVWRASDDVAQLNRLGSRVNLTVHDFELDGEQCREIKVNTGRGIISLHYGSDSQKELERIQKHLIRATGRKAWLLEREYAHRGFLTNQMWTATEAEQLIQDGHVTNYRAELVHPIHLYPELANDPMNIRFKRKS